MTNSTTKEVILSLIGEQASSARAEINNKLNTLGLKVLSVDSHEHYEQAVSIKLTGETENIEQLQQYIEDKAEALGFDALVQPASLKPRGLVVFDMDSTLIQHEVIVEVAREAGMSDKVSEITEAAMRGELDFCGSFRKRMELLKGVNISVVDNIYNNLKMMDGADRLLKFLKENGFKVAILSGGFTYFANRIKDKYGLDFICANEIITEDGIITGETGERIIDADAKAEMLKELMNKYGFEAKDTVAIGDGANDLKMIAAAGLGIAFHGKPMVRTEAPYAVNSVGLDAAIVPLQFYK